jgi:hypothetical protein
MISLGDTFWAQNPNSNNPPHLYFVITDSIRNGGRVLLVNMTERKTGSDESCILKRGDHPSVTKESVIQYAEAIFPEARKIEQVAYTGVFKSGVRAESSLVRRILAGAMISRHLRMEHRLVVEAELKALGASS